MGLSASSTSPTGGVLHKLPEGLPHKSARVVVFSLQSRPREEQGRVREEIRVFLVHAVRSAVVPGLASAASLLLTVVACAPKATPVTPAPAPPRTATAPVTPATQPAPAPRDAQPAQPTAKPPSAASAGATPASVTAVPPPPRPPAIPPLVGHVTRASLRDYAPWQPVIAQVYAPIPPSWQPSRPRFVM